MNKSPHSQWHHEEQIALFRKKAGGLSNFRFRVVTQAVKSLIIDMDGKDFP